MTADRFIELCDLAECAPDWPARWRWGTDRLAAAALSARLEDHGHEVSEAECLAAIEAWDARPRGKEHTVGTFKL